MKHDFLITPSVLSQASENGGHSGGGARNNEITRRAFIKRTGRATVATLVAWNLANNLASAETSTSTSTSGSSGSWALICKQEPAEGDWGDSLRDVVGAHGGNIGLSFLMGGNRYLSLAVAVTNYDSPTWGGRCIRTGSPGRGTDHSWAKVCVAGAFLPIVDSVGGRALTVLKPKHYVICTVDKSTGKITVTDSGAGHTQTGIAGGATVKAISKISITGNNTNLVTLDVEWSLEWTGFKTAEINLIKTWVRFGASANNKLIWNHSGRFIFEAVRESDLSTKCSSYAAMRIDRVHSWNDENGHPRADPSPFGYYVNPGVPLSTLRSVSALTSAVSEFSTGSAQQVWEF